MIEDKEIPVEYVNIRQAWIKAINRVAESIAYRFKHDVDNPYDQRTGQQTVIESIIALKTLLVDYGEALIKTEVEEWYERHRGELDGADSFKVHNFYKKWFEFMVETLNKYGMLFESQPKGYSNTVMKSV